MSLNQEDLEFVHKVNDLLVSGITPEQVAQEVDMSYSSLRYKIDKLGYDLEITTTRRLVPKRAPELDDAA